MSEQTEQEQFERNFEVNTLQASGIYISAKLKKSKGNDQDIFLKIESKIPMQEKIRFAEDICNVLNALAQQPLSPLMEFYLKDAQQPDHSETVLKVQKALGFPDECFVDPDVILNRIWKAQQPAIDGNWLWGKLMDWCKKRGVSPAEHNDLFKIVKEARAQQPVAEQEPVMYQYRTRAIYEIGHGNWTDWIDCSKGGYDEKKDMTCKGFEYEARKLYTSPQPAQPDLFVVFSEHPDGHIRAWTKDHDSFIAKGELGAVTKYAMILAAPAEGKP